MLQTLYKLQKLEAEEAAVLTSQKNCEEYRLLREMKGEFERLKQALLQKQELLTALQKETRSLPNELAQISEQTEKERAALYDGSIANIRELAARETQIASLEERSAALAATLAEKQTELRRLMHQAKTLQQRITEQHQQFTQQYHQYETLREGWQKTLDALNEGKQALLAEISEQDLDWYQKQKPLFFGLPVASLDTNRVCDGCRTLVTPILYKRTVYGERTRCEKCGRYLFIAESGAAPEPQ